MRIEVTEEDIRKGVRLDCYECPVALAISRATESDAHVEGDVMLDGNRRRVFVLPDEVTRRIRVYDFVGEMEPFSFDLAI